MVASLEGIRSIPYIPVKGTRILSINLALVDHAEVISVVSRLGFKPEIIQVARRKKTELHALLWQGVIENTPHDLEEKVDALADSDHYWCNSLRCWCMDSCRCLMDSA